MGKKREKSGKSGKKSVYMLSKYLHLFRDDNASERWRKEKKVPFKHCKCGMPHFSVAYEILKIIFSSSNLISDESEFGWKCDGRAHNFRKILLLLLWIMQPLKSGENVSKIAMVKTIFLPSFCKLNFRLEHITAM